MKRRLAILFLLMILSFAGPALAGYEGTSQYYKALQYVKEKQYDFAFMEFRAVIKDFPESKYARESLFAVGEYFYTTGAYHEAIRYFSDYVRKYPDSPPVIFARAYLLKIIEAMEGPNGEKTEIAENIEMEFFSQPLFLLFSEYKEVFYKSPFGNKFSIRYYIDMIEVYRNDALFLKITQ